MANVRRRVNKSLIVQEVRNTAVVCGDDLFIRWRWFETVSISLARQAHTSATSTGTAGVTVAPHGRGDTFTLKTLKSIIEMQARWTEDDLKRLNLLS